MTSIRRRQTTLLIAGAIVLYVACSLVIERSVRHALYREFDATLVSKASGLAALLEEETRPEVEFDFADEVMIEFASESDPEYFEVWIPDEEADEGWRSLSRSWSLKTAHLPRTFGPQVAPRIWNLELRDGRAGRAVGIVFPIDIEEAMEGQDGDDAEDVESGVVMEAIVVVARSRQHVQKALGSVVLGVVLAGGFLCLAIVPLVSWSVRQSMKPVAQLGRRVGDIDAAALRGRLDVTELPVELRPIVVGLNQLLERLDAAFERERRTTANIAHELRTPIAELRSATDVAARWADDEELAQNAVQTARSVAVQMEGIVEILLKLSRIESGQLSVRDESIRLAPFVERQWRALAVEAGSRGLLLERSISDRIKVRGDADALELILRNVLSNAVSHAPEGDHVEVWARPDGEACVLSVANTNTSLEPAELDRIEEAFWTKDEARSDHEHTGLGLAMVAAVGRATSTKVDFAIEQDRFVVAIRLPLVSDGPRLNGNAH